MKNKKSFEMGFGVIITAVLAIVLLLAVLFEVIPIFTGKQVPWLRGQTEGVTSDCDGDGVIGLSDQCPCSFSMQTKESNQACPSPDSSASTNCPDLCKSVTRSAKK